MNVGRYLIAGVVAILGTGAAASGMPACAPILWSGLVLVVVLAAVAGAVKREVRIRRRLAAIHPRPVAHTPGRIGAGR